jgi:hypothetical protein
MSPRHIRTLTIYWSSGGGPRLANLFTLLENCRQASVEPEAYLIDLVTTLAGASARDLGEWLPRTWKRRRSGGIA